jgi:hypothetical protein
MITIATTVEGIRTRKDNTCAITFGTQELTPSQAGDLFHLNGKFCYLAIKPETFRKEEIEAMDELKTDFEDNGKSPGQRLRGVLYRKWENNKEGFSTFTLYYEHNMEKIITHFKSQLP